MAENENEKNYFDKKEMKQTSYYLEKNSKEKFQKICSRLQTSCNKQLCNFVDEFIIKHKNVLDAKRKS